MTIRRAILRNAHHAVLRALTIGPGQATANRLLGILHRIRARVMFPGYISGKHAAKTLATLSRYAGAERVRLCDYGTDKAAEALRFFLESEDAGAERADHIIRCCRAANVEHAESHHDERTGTVFVLGKLRGEWGSWVCNHRSIPGLNSGRYYGRDCTGTEAQDRFDNRIASRRD